MNPAELRENRAAFIAEIILGLERTRAILDAADARADELAARIDAKFEQGCQDHGNDPCDICYPP